MGDSTSSAIGAAEIGKRAVENNFLTKWDLEERNKLLDKFEKQAYLSPIEQQVISGLLMKDGRTDELLQRYQTHPETLTKEEKRFLFQTVDAYVASHPGVTRESVLMMDPMAKIDRPTQGVITYLQQQNAWNARPEIQIARGVKDGMVLAGSLVTIKSPVVTNVLGNPVVLNTASGLTANATAQSVVGQPFNWTEFISTGITSAMTTGMPLGKTLIVNAGMGAATSFAVKGNIPQDTALSVLGGVAGEKLPNPILKIYTPEMLQKFPNLLDKYFSFPEDKSE